MPSHGSCFELSFREVLLHSWRYDERHLACAYHLLPASLEGLRPLPPTPADSRSFGFFDFSQNVDFGNFPVGFGVWEGLQSIGNGGGLQMDGFSAHFDPYEFILDDFHDFEHFEAVSGGLTLIPEGPRTLRECPEGPGTL